MLVGSAAHQSRCWGALYLLAAGLALTSETRPPCPQTCRCSPAGSEVNCSHAQLTAVPDTLPRDADLLSLTHNAIGTLARGQFQALSRLSELDVSDNLLAAIEAEAFLGLRSLTELRLARNRLRIVPAGAFSGLPKLQRLDLSANQLLVLLDFTFRDLAALRVIDATENDFVFVSRQAFGGLADLQELRLDAGNLSAAPTEALGPLAGLRVLRLQRFGANALPNYSFSQLGRLRELFISGCPWLETLPGNSLFGLNLTSLTIRSCNLSAVPYIPLHHLVYLTHLDLSYNPITFIQGNRLGDLLRLQEFLLIGGSLLRIEPAAFKGLAHLKVLNVSGNLLSTLEWGAFHSVEALQRLGLDNNPLSCDCRLLWVVRRRLYLDFGGSSPTCMTSVHLPAWNFLDFSEAELPGLLSCRPPHILVRKPQQVSVDQGHTVVLYCKAEGDPSPSVTWLSPQLRPLSLVGRIRAVLNGSLEVRYAQPQDSGTYLCVASNAAGNDSLSVNLRVRSFSSSSKNPFRLKSWFAFPSAAPGVNRPGKLPFDLKTLLVAASIGFVSFFSSVSVCFIFMFFWSKGKGQIKHTATIAYVPRGAMSAGSGAGGQSEPSRFTMKLI